MSGPMPLELSELAELLSAGDVAADPVGELAGPVPADGAGKVALLVRGRVDVDLDEADVRIVEMGLGPFGVDEDVAGVSGNGHGDLPPWNATALMKLGPQYLGRGGRRAAGPAPDTRSGPA